MRCWRHKPRQRLAPTCHTRSAVLSERNVGALFPDNSRVARNVTVQEAVRVVSSTGTGMVRVAARVSRSQAVIEQLDAVGGITQIRMTPDELRRYAVVLMRVAAVLEEERHTEEATER